MLDQIEHGGFSCLIMSALDSMTWEGYKLKN